MKRFDEREFVSVGQMVHESPSCAIRQHSFFYHLFLDTVDPTQLYPHKFMSEATDHSSPKLVRGLGLLDASMIV
ncbi:MAG: hypothetical protein ACMG6H_11885, partial [Acidobacteriota bacterium]